MRWTAGSGPRAERTRGGRARGRRVPTVPGEGKDRAAPPRSSSQPGMDRDHVITGKTGPPASASLIKEVSST